MDEETIIYICVCVVVALLVAIGSTSYGPLALVVAVLAVVAIALIFLINYADFIIFPIFTKVFRINIIPAKNYTIPRSQDSVIKYINGLYYATGYLTANIYNYVFSAEEVNEGEDAGLKVAPENWEKAIMNVDFPFRFNMVSAVEEIQNYRNDLEGKRGFLEFQYGREMGAANPNPVSIEEIQRKMRVIQTRIDRMGQGERPVDSMMYIETIGVGISEKEAVDRLTDQLNQLQTVFNVFDLSITRVVGRELYMLNRLNYIIPGIKELDSDFQLQR